MTDQEEPLSTLAVRLGVVEAANDVLARLDAERDVFRVEWLSRPTLEQSKAALAESWIGYATIDTSEADAFDQLVGDVVETLHDYQAKALNSARTTLATHRTKPGDAASQARLAAALVACAVATDTVRWHTSMSVGLYAYFHVRVPFFLLRSAAETTRVHVSEPVIRACDVVLNGAPLSTLKTALATVAPKLAEGRAYFDKLGATVKVGAEISRKVMAALYAAEFVFSVYHAGLAARGLLGGGPPTPPPLGGLQVAGGGALARAGVMYDWELLLRRLAIVGGIGLHAAMAKLGGSATKAPTPAPGGEKAAPAGGPDPDDNYGGTVDYDPRSLPQPAPDDLYATPVNATAAAAWQRQEAAYEAAEAAKAAGRSLADLPKGIMRRLGYFGMRRIYPDMIRIVRGGRGLSYFRGTVTPQFIRSLRGQARRVMFVETSVKVAGSTLRLDSFEVTFGLGRKPVDAVEIIDLTTTLRTEHVLKTAEYAKVFSDLGFTVKASDILLTNGVKLLDDLVVVPIDVP